MGAKKARASRPRFNPADANEANDIYCDAGGDWPEEQLICIACCRGGGLVEGNELLSCCIVGCPFAVHKMCAQSDQRYDEVGRYYCPYCWCVREGEKVDKCRKKVIYARKYLSAFLNAKEVIDDDEEKRNDRVDLDKEVRDAVVGAKVGCENSRKGANRIVVQCAHGERISEDQMDAARGPVVGNDNIHHGEKEKKRRIESAKDPMAMTKENACVENMAEVHEDEVMENGGGIQEKDEGQGDGIPDQGVLGGKERVEHLNSCCVEEDTVSANVSKRDHGCSYAQKPRAHVQEPTLLFMENVAVKPPGLSDLENATVTENQRHTSSGVKQAEQSQKDAPKKPPPQAQTSISEGKDGNQSKNISLHGTSTQPTESPKKHADLMFHHNKSKRLFWTLEEEAKLKEGVQKFKFCGKKNLPWKKILEFGQDVFHPARNAAALKEKWKKIQEKEEAHKTLSVG